MNALDLYAGIGGWSLGLGLAGVKVVASYEWWSEANLTNARNNRHQASEVDIRSIDFSRLPKVEVVVGSPPCTHFSLANRGGKGNILEGLKDVESFLQAVLTLRPRFWAMENVPRLATIFQSEINQGGVLHRFAELNPTVAVVDCSEWGVPQRRKRAIIGNFDLDLLLSYRKNCPTVTLGGVVSSLASDTAVDPVYGIKLAASEVTDHQKESYLSKEEERINRDAKENHPIYNGMSFPDDPSRPSRTVTATCTRVSRESIVIKDGAGFRRLTLRERAALQSFPITYRFYGGTHSGKQKMIGNALPPLFAYYVAHSMMGTPPSALPSPSVAIGRFVPPADPPPPTRPDRISTQYGLQRKFRACVPGLRFKSGTRFELSNFFRGPRPEWKIRFFFGDSKRVREVDLGGDLLTKMESIYGVRQSVARAKNALIEQGGLLNHCDPVKLQRVWGHRKENYRGPHDLVDSIADAVRTFIERDGCDMADACIGSLVDSWGSPPGSKKLVRNARGVFAGLVVCSVANEILASGKASRNSSKKQPSK